MDDVKVYDAKAQMMQSHIPFLENFIKDFEKKPNEKPGFLEKLKTIYKFANTATKTRYPLANLVKIEGAITALKNRAEQSSREASKSVAVKKEATELNDKASVCESVSETPDSPSPTRPYERTSPIEIPTERSDDRDHKIKKEKDSRYDDNRRYRQDNQRSERSDKYGHSSRYDKDRHRSRYEQHERSKSRDRFKHERRSNSSERSRHGKNDRHRYENNADKHRHQHDRGRDKYDPFEDRDHSNSWKKFDERTDRLGGSGFKLDKSERSDRYSPVTQRDNKKMINNPESVSHNSAFNRLGVKVQSTAPKSSDDRFTDDDISELLARNKKLFGCDSDDEVTNELKNLSEVRSKLATQIKLAEMKSKEKNIKPPSTVTSNELPTAEMNKISINAPSRRATSKFELNSLRECSPAQSNHPIKDESNKFSFIQTFNQASKTVDRGSEESLRPKITVDDDIIKKIATQPINAKDERPPPRILPAHIPDMDMVKQALATAKMNDERLALKYNPRVKPRVEQNIPDINLQPHQSEHSQSHNLQMVCANDPRLPRVRDPRMQAHQDSMRIQAFSPPSTPPCIPNYPPIIQSIPAYKQNSYPKPGLLPHPNHFPPHPQQNVYPPNMSPQHHANLTAIPPHISNFNNQRTGHQLSPSPVSSTELSPPVRYQYHAPVFPENNRNPQGIHSKFRPSLNDSVERQKYEQSRQRRTSLYRENNEPMTYGEYRRSRQSAVSSTSEKVNETVTNQSNISSSIIDTNYRSRNYADTPSIKFKIPKKTTNETAKSNEIRSAENWDKHESEDEQANVQGVKDSDDSEHEISKACVNSDSEATDSRDPRIRVQALKRASLSSEGKTKDSSEKQNNIVTSSTSVLPDTQENMEVLKQLINPNNLLALINLMGTMSGDSTLTKVKELLEMHAKEQDRTTPVPHDDSSEHLNTATERGKIEVPKTPRKKQKNELEKLNEDIRTMFISDGVLNATGRRVCALYNNANDSKESSAGKNAKVKKQAKDDVAIGKQTQPGSSRITRRRNTMVCYTEPPARTLKPSRETDIEPEPAPITIQASKKSAEEPKAKTSPEVKSTAPEHKVAKKTTKAKKQPEPIKDADEQPTKRITRAQMKPCNIVIEKLDPAASVESLTNAESPKKGVKGKRTRNDSQVNKPEPKKAKKDTALPEPTIKNDDPDCHSLKKIVDCQICDKTVGRFIVSHYVNEHPNCEVPTSRLPPNVADLLSNSKDGNKCERLKQTGKKYHEFTQHCYFCDVSKCLTKAFWISHLAKHTGYYLYKCVDCSRKFSEKITNHICKLKKNKDKVNLEKIPQPQFEKDNVKAFICDLCNYVRFNKIEMEKHLRCQHDSSPINKYKEVSFITFPKRKTKVQLEEEDMEMYESDQSNDETESSLPKRKKLDSSSDFNDKDESGNSEKILRSRVVSEAFIAEPKEDGLFDKDTMKLMKDMSFSASKDAACTSTPIRTKSIAEKLSERFNSVQEDSICKSEDSEKTKTEPLDPLTCDEGIPIINVAPIDDSPNEESNAKPEKASQSDKVSPSSAAISNREDNVTPTEEFGDESDDNWESYSSDDSDEDAEPVAESVALPGQSNRKNVGIIDTITRLQQSISLQSNATPSEGVDKQSEATPQPADKASIKDESETTSVASEQPTELETSFTQSEDELNVAVKSITKGKQTKEAKNVPLTFETIVNEAIQSEDTDSPVVDDAKQCVSNGRSPNGNYSFNLTGTNKPASQLGSRSSNLGGSSSNSDLTNNDVEMEDLNKPAKILTRIDNIGYTRSTSSFDSSVSFCCLINECGFESTDLSELLYHIEDHPVEWFGFCYTCNSQIHENQVQLMMEFKHMTQAHYTKKDDNDVNDKPDNSGKPSFIKCKLLPGDKLSKLKEAEIAAKAEQLSINPKPSTSTSSSSSTTMTQPSKPAVPNLIKIANVTSLTTTPAVIVQPKPTSFVIANVVSLGSSSKEYSDTEMVSLKVWVKNQTLKSQKICKRMLRDICLYALYKCMDTNCAFTTDNADKMLIHLRNHENSAVQMENLPSWLECSYCDVVADSCSFLVKHIQEEHQSSIFQCPYCFYRACAVYNVIVHLSQFHQSEKKSVLVCNGKPRLYSTEKALIEKSRGENIRALRCTEDCNKITYVMDYFVKHMRSSSNHTDKFKCQFCGYNTLISETAKHLLVHSVGVYECVYCHYGINDIQSIQNHMCNTHPSKLLYICVRLTRKGQILSEEQLGSVDSTLIFHLGQPVDKKLFQKCPFTDEQLSDMNPLIASSSNPTQSSVVSSPVLIRPVINSPPSEIEITSVTSISNESFSNVETVASAGSGLILNDVLSYKDLEKEYMFDDWDKYFATLISSPQPSTSKRKSSTQQAKIELPEGRKASTPSTSRTDLLQDEIDAAAYILVKGTGLEGRDLYRCSFANCDDKSDDILAFNIHLLQHNHSQIGFKCYHCNVISKNIVGLKYHIKVHGIHRYFCYFCNYTSAIVNDIQKHMQDTHSRTHVNTIPLNQKKHDQNKDMFIMCPRGLRQDDLNRFGITLIERNKRQLTSTKKFYSPEDMESLPRQAIFNSSISCEVCAYSTKVRTNMYRHLAAHKDEKSVPKVDPVNPVPCLDSGEKHFDKMINLACSSNDGKPIANQYDSSAFVPIDRRFVCNARNCQYQNISDGMLKRHLTTLHANEEQYKCPHCNTLICQKMDADKVIFHLRMHDSKIYKCPKCAFSHHIKSIVEKHKDEVHPGTLDQATLITRDETTSTPGSSLDGQPKVSKWKCMLCNDLHATQKQVQSHIQIAHCIKYQYQCDICAEVQSNNKLIIQEHITQKHPDQDSRIKVYYTKVECAENDNTPIWRRDDPNKIKHIRGILFEEENVRKTSSPKKDQTEVKKKTLQKKRSDKPVVEQNSDIGDVPVINEPETNSLEDSESNPIVIISDEDTDADKTNNEPVKKLPTTQATPSTSKNLLESGKSFMGSSKALIKPSQTVVRAEATSSGIKNKKESSLHKAYLCGRCCNFSDNTIALVRAHQATAHPNIVCEVFMRNTSEAQQNKSTAKPLPDVPAVNTKQKFADSINYVCYHCIFKSANPITIYKHWKENHKFPKITTKNIEFPPRQFMFRILKIFKCYYCRKLSNYKDLKVHSQRYHPQETFAMIDNVNPKTCAFCSHQFTNIDAELVNHFSESHKNLMKDSSIEPDNYLTDELLDEMMAVLPREQVKCSYCSIVFFSKTELDGHTKDKHSGSEMKYTCIPNDPVMYGCSSCQKTNSSESLMVAHIREHFLQYQCNYCEKRFNEVNMVKVHHEIMHPSQTSEGYRHIDINENLGRYLSMKIIFSNGLVLTKSEAKHTRYGGIDEVKKLIKKLNDDELEVVVKKQEEERKKVVEKVIEKVAEKPVVVVRRKGGKRNQISDSDDSDDSDSESEAKSPTKATSKLRKRRRLTTDRVTVPSKTPIIPKTPVPSKPTVPTKTPVPSKSAVSSKQQTNTSSDDNEPLQRLIPFTYYGKKSRPVNLSKIFIQMTLGDSSVRVSCDRFALLFNINPKLRLKRCRN